MCLGNWQSDRIVHWCHGCCADRAQAVFTVFTLVHGIIVEHAMGTVAVSKWMSLMPAVQHIACMAVFHGLLMHVESAVNCRMKKPAADHIAADVVTPDLQEIRKAWSRRAAAFMHAKSTLVALLSFIKITQPLMHLHCKLFVDGKRCAARPLPWVRRRKTRQHTCFSSLT